MMGDFIYKKGRKRKYVGDLKEFSDLSDTTQKIFKKIKSEITREMNGDVNVYVFGSYAWGYSDEKSDYDVRVDQPLPSNKHIGKIVSERVKEQVHIQYLPKKFKDSPLIP